MDTSYPRLTEVKARPSSQFAAFGQDIALPVEEKAPALPPDMAECFNSSFQGDLSGLAKVQALLKSIQRPSNADMKVKPTNKEIFAIRHGAMPSLRKADCSLQNVQTILVKSSCSMMKVADDLAKAEKEDQSVDVGDTIKCPRGGHPEYLGPTTHGPAKA